MSESEMEITDERIAVLEQPNPAPEQPEAVSPKVEPAPDNLRRSRRTRATALIDLNGGKKMDTVTAILIDPDQRKITQVHLPVDPPEGDEKEWCTNQLRLDDIYALLDCRRFGASQMPGCEEDCCFYNDESLDADGKQIGFFQLGRHRDAVPGKCLVVGFDVTKHEYSDATTTIEQVETSVIWTRRIVRAYPVTTTKTGIRIDRVAPIIDER